MQKAGVDVLFDESRRATGREIQGRGSHRDAVTELPWARRVWAEGVVRVKARRSPEVVKVKIEDIVRVVVEKVEREPRGQGESYECRRDSRARARDRRAGRA